MKPTKSKAKRRNPKDGNEAYDKVLALSVSMVQTQMHNLMHRTITTICSATPGYCRQRWVPSQGQ